MCATIHVFRQRLPLLARRTC